MTKMGRLKKGDIFNRIAYELFGVKIGEDEEVVPSAGVAAKQDGKHPAAQKPAPVVPAPEPVKPAPAVATTYIAPGTELTGTLKTDSNVEICGKFEGDIISTGTVLLPWAAVLCVAGNVPRGIALAALYAVIAVVRSVLEPKIVAAQVGLPPLVALAAMYVGFCVVGVAGMILLPLAVLVVKQLHDGGFVGLWR